MTSKIKKTIKKVVKFISANNYLAHADAKAGMMSSVAEGSLISLSSNFNELLHGVSGGDKATRPEELSVTGPFFVR